MPRHPAKAVANCLIELAWQDEAELDPLKLQKLVFFAHGWHLGLKKEPLIKEAVQAWDFGPVIPALYHEFKGFGREPITRKATDIKVVRTDGGIVFSEEQPTVGEDESVRDFLHSFWDVYGKYTGIQLSNATHAPGTPWRQVRDAYQGEMPRGVEIPDDLIQEYFQAQASNPATT